jgi:hypothetical protein
VTFGEDKEGTIWRFPNSCIGDGLTEVQFNDGYPECPPLGIDLVEVMARAVSADNTCLGAPYVIDRVQADNKCLTEEPVVYSATNDTYVENGCNQVYSWELVSDARRKEVMEMPDCE